MTQTEKILALIEDHEAYRAKPYRCSAGKLTIGIGRNIEDRGISHDEAVYMAFNDIGDAIHHCHAIFDRFMELSGVRQAILIDMCFNMGPDRFRGFKKMIAAINARDYEKAADEMVDSLWYKQVGRRSKRLVAMMRTDKWPKFLREDGE